MAKLRLTGESVGTASLYDAEIMEGTYTPSDALEWNEQEDGTRETDDIDDDVANALAEKYDVIEVVDSSDSESASDETDASAQDADTEADQPPADHTTDVSESDSE